MRMHPIVPAIVLALAIVRALAGGVSWLTFVSVPLATLWLVTEIRGWNARRDSDDSDPAAAPPSAPTPEQTRELLATVDTIRRMRQERERPSLLPTEAEILATAKPAILVQRADLAVTLDHPGRSYLGGMPRLPADMPWPEIEKHERVALTFLAQIDLAELPVLESSPLPRSGTLYFFADTNDDAPEPTACRVLFYAGDTARVPIRELPANLGAGGNGGGPWPWLPEDSVWARTGFRYPLSFTAFDSYRDYTVEPGANHPPGRNRVAFERLMHAQYARRFGGPATAPREPWQILSQDRDEWPFAWIAIEYGARALAHAAERAAPHGSADGAAAFRKIVDTCAAWIERAAREEPCTTCDAPLRAEFLREWRALAGQSEATGRRLWLQVGDIVFAACQTCASHGRPEVIPPIYRDALARHNGASLDFPHQLLGHGQKVQWAPIGYDQHVLLLQLLGDAGLGWHPGGSCAVQFWVDPAAAARAEFDHVEMTVECD